MIASILVVEALAPGSDIRDRDWRDDGLCTQIDADLWFPEKGGGNSGVKRICGRCPVREQCLQWALENHPVEGIWGGTSQRERQRRLSAAIPADDAQSGRRLAA